MNFREAFERPNITAVFGTSAPPSGLSGAIRRKAFEKDEGSYGRWLPLILADRIGAYKGIIDDLKKELCLIPLQKEAVVRNGNIIDKIF